MVTAAAREGLPVRPVGAGHSFAPLAATDGVMVRRNDHVEFSWFPHTEKALLKRNNRVPDGTPAAPLGRLRYLIEDELLSNGAFEALNRVGHAVPALVPRINALSGSVLSAREDTAPSHDVFVSPRRVRFCESEFAMPREARTSPPRRTSSPPTRGGRTGASGTR